MPTRRPSPPPCPLRRAKWVVYAKPPFAGPQQVLAYLGRYTHRVAIANSRLLDADDGRFGFRWRDYRHPARRKVMTLPAGESIRRFLLHSLPDGLHRIRYYGFFANGQRTANLALCRQLLAEPASSEPAREAAQPSRTSAQLPHICPDCGGRMLPIGPFVRPFAVDSS